MSDDKKYGTGGRRPTGPLTKVASKHVMELRDMADDLRKKAIITQNAFYDAFEELQEGSPAPMTAALGPMEEKLAEIMAVAGKARTAHFLGADVVRKSGMDLPDNPPYSGDPKEEVPFRVHPPQRR
jgi:hypothetical protein